MELLNHLILEHQNLLDHLVLKHLNLLDHLVLEHQNLLLGHLVLPHISPDEEELMVTSY